ncbi:crotonase/enoyl-CoA hydratase family protein [uncultured Shewanella sp.]|uniref:crotonase/enoyl-CoA hydratase family protein n=1 Tax=Shewanella atlantica TaxID=271099 RepID=UPI0026237190|nr:crotonase/enoyl-CoA hydratase family protein [uncultured Shewanella sp.]
MAGKYIKLDVDDAGVARVVIDRPEKYNALNFTMFKELDNVIRELRKDLRVKVVILSGAAGNFSSGLDVKSVVESPIQPIKLLFKWLPGNANLAQRVSFGWRNLPIPVIAVLEGCCFGGGMQIALGADIRIAGEDARISIMEAKWGLVPDMAGLVSLRELVGKDQAMLLTMTAKILSAQESLDRGLVTEVSDSPMQRALSLASELANTSPDANAAIKMSINRSWGASIRSLLSRESLSQIRLLLGRNRIIAAKRQSQKAKAKSGNRATGEHVGNIDYKHEYKQRQAWW